MRCACAVREVGIRWWGYPSARPLTHRVHLAGCSPSEHGHTRHPAPTRRWTGGSARRALPLGYDDPCRMARVDLTREHPDHTLNPTALVHERGRRPVSPIGMRSAWVSGGSGERRYGRMRTGVEMMRGCAAGAQAAAEPGCGGASDAPGPVVSGEALIEGIGPRGRIAGGVPWRRRIEGE